MRNWLRRHVRFATTTNGRSMIHLFAATLALSSGNAAGAALGDAEGDDDMEIEGGRRRRKVVEKGANKRQAMDAEEMDEDVTRDSKYLCGAVDEASTAAPDDDETEW